MLGGREGLYALVESVGTASGVGLVELAAMAVEAVGECMTAPVLMVLIGISALGLGRVQEGETDSVVVGLSQPYLQSFITVTP